MQIKTQEHIDLMSQFEREFKGKRLDREVKDFWPRGRIYEDGQANELFLAYRRGYALARCVYSAEKSNNNAEVPPSSAEGRPPEDQS